MKPCLKAALLLFLFPVQSFAQVWGGVHVNGDLGIDAGKYSTLEEAVNAAIAQGKKTIYLSKQVPVATTARYTVPDSLILQPVNGGGISPTFLVTIEARVVDPGPVQWIFGNLDSAKLITPDRYARPEWFGSDSTEIQRAVRSGAKEIELSSQIYYAQSAILIDSSKIHLFSKVRSTIKPIANFPSGELLSINGSDCDVSSIVFDGDNLNQNQDILFGIKIESGQKRNKIIANKFQNFNRSGVYILGDYNSIEKNEFTSCGQNSSSTDAKFAIYVSGARNWIHGNYIHDTKAGIKINFGSPDHNEVINNRIENVGAAGDATLIGISTTGKYTLIKNNRVIDVLGGNGIDVAYTASYSQVVNNFSISNGGAGIFVGHEQAGVKIEGVLVEGNTCISNGDDPNITDPAQKSGILLGGEGQNRIRVQNNHVESNLGYGIALYRSYQCVVSENIVYSNTEGGIYLFGDATRWVTNNVISGGLIANHSVAGKYGVKIAGNSSGNRLIGVEFMSNANDFSFGGSGNVIKLRGNGSPEGVHAAAVGSTWERLDGATGTVLYVKESGTSTTGWVAK